MLPSSSAASRKIFCCLANGARQYDASCTLWSTDTWVSGFSSGYSLHSCHRPSLAQSSKGSDMSDECVRPDVIGRRSAKRYRLTAYPYTKTPVDVLIGSCILISLVYLCVPDQYTLQWYWGSRAVITYLDR